MRYILYLIIIALSFDGTAKAEGLGDVLLSMEQNSPDDVDNVKNNNNKLKVELSVNNASAKVVPQNILRNKGDTKVKILSCYLSGCVGVVNNWHIARGDSLRNLLYKWTEMTGWSLVWDSRYDYEISSSADIHDDLISAINRLIKCIGVVNPPIFVDAYEGNKVVRVRNSIDK